MNLDNPLDVTVYYLLIEKMTCFGCQDNFLWWVHKYMWCTLDKTYGESWCKTISCHDLLNYYNE